MYIMAKIANLAEKNRQMAGKNVNEVTKGVSYKVNLVKSYGDIFDNKRKTKKCDIRYQAISMY